MNDTTFTIIIFICGFLFGLLYDAIIDKYSSFIANKIEENRRERRKEVQSFKWEQKARKAGDDYEKNLHRKN